MVVVASPVAAAAVVVLPRALEVETEREGGRDRDLKTGGLVLRLVGRSIIGIGDTGRSVRPRAPVTLPEPEPEP